MHKRGIHGNAKELSSQSSLPLPFSPLLSLSSAPICCLGGEGEESLERRIKKIKKYEEIWLCNTPYSQVRATYTETAQYCWRPCEPGSCFLVFSLSLSSGWHTTVSSLYSYEVVYMLMKEGKNQQCASDTTPTPQPLPSSPSWNSWIWVISLLMACAFVVVGIVVLFFVLFLFFLLKT